MSTLLNFPELSRAPQMDMEEEWEDNAIRDKMENGSVQSRPRYSRMRKTLSVSYSLLTADDRKLLIGFLRSVGGWADFHFTDSREQSDPETLKVYFSQLPKISDDKWAGGCKRYKVTFKVTER